MQHRSDQIIKEKKKKKTEKEKHTVQMLNLHVKETDNQKSHSTYISSPASGSWSSGWGRDVDAFSTMWKQRNGLAAFLV